MCGCRAMPWFERQREEEKGGEWCPTVWLRVTDYKMAGSPKAGATCCWAGRSEGKGHLHHSSCWSDKIAQGRCTSVQPTAPFSDPILSCPAWPARCARDTRKQIRVSARLPFWLVRLARLDAIDGEQQLPQCVTNRRLHEVLQELYIAASPRLFFRTSTSIQTKPAADQGVQSSSGLSTARARPPVPVLSAQQNRPAPGPPPQRARAHRRRTAT